MSFLQIIFFLTFMFAWAGMSVFANGTSSNAVAEVQSGQTAPDKSAGEEDQEENEEGRESKKPEFDRYQSIIDRAPFGVPPPGFNREAVPGSSAAAPGDGTGGPMTEEQRSVEEQKIISEVQVSVLSITPAGSTMVGFTDKANHRNYYLKVGAEKDGWKVVSADAAAQSVVLSKGGVEATVQVGSASSSSKGNDKKGAARGETGGMPSPAGHAAQTSSESAPFGGLLGRPGGGGHMNRLRQRSLLERRKRMEEEDSRRQKEEQAKKEAQSLREQLNAMKEKVELEALQREENEKNFVRRVEDALKQRNAENRPENNEGTAVPSGEGE